MVSFIKNKNIQSLIFDTDNISTPTPFKTKKEKKKKRKEKKREDKEHK